MINIEFKSIIDLLKAFPDEQTCIDHLEILRWNGNIVSPFDVGSKIYICKDNKYKCKTSGKYFNVKTATLFDNTKVELQKWFLAIYLITSHKKGISSVQLAKDIDVTQKTAWFMLQRIRNCFEIEEEDKLHGIIEADETFVGGKNKNRHADKKVKYSQGRSFKDKTPVLGILERDIKEEAGLNKAGNMKFNILKPKKVKLIVVPSTSKKDIQPHIGECVEKGSTFYSDEWKGYNGLESRYNHQFVDHSKKQYVATDNPEIHTNTIEGFWSILKRGIIGIYHKTTRKHLQLYCNEFEFRYNRRHLSIDKLMDVFFVNIEHRLTYKELIG